MLALPIVIAGVSSLLIVPTPAPSAMVALDGLERFTLKVSFDSGVVSPFTSTVIVCVRAPGLNVNVPDAAVKSVGADAELLLVA